MVRLICCVLILASVAGCGRFGLDRIGGGADNRAIFNGIRFNPKLEAGEDRRNFTILVTPVTVDPRAAQEAGRYEATKYCLRNYGGSNVAWTISPDIPTDQMRIVDDTTTLTGRCIKR